MSIIAAWTNAAWLLSHVRWSQALEIDRMMSLSVKDWQRDMSRNTCTLHGDSVQLDSSTVSWLLSCPIPVCFSFDVWIRFLSLVRSPRWTDQSIVFFINFVPSLACPIFVIRCLWNKDHAALRSAEVSPLHVWLTFCFVSPLLYFTFILHWWDCQVMF